MSAILGFCNMDFGVLLADTRRTLNCNGGYVIADEHTQKIFKINSAVLFGATGLFNKNEDILSALESVKDRDSATLHDVYTSVCGYLDTHKFGMPPMRNYVICGKDDDGGFCIYEIHMNFETYEIETTIRKPQQNEYAMMCALPAKAKHMSDSIIASMGAAINTSKTVEEAIRKTAGIFYSFTKVDDTVNTNIMAIRISR